MEKIILIVIFLCSAVIASLQAAAPAAAPDTLHHLPPAATHKVAKLEKRLQKVLASSGLRKKTDADTCIQFAIALPILLILYGIVGLIFSFKLALLSLLLGLGIALLLFFLLLYIVSNWSYGAR